MQTTPSSQGYKKTAKLRAISRSADSEESTFPVSITARYYQQKGKKANWQKDKKANRPKMAN